MRRGLPSVVAGLGTMLALVGLAVVLASEAEPVVVYEGSYAPLDPETLDANRSVLERTFDGMVIWTGAELVGGALLVMGLLVLTAVGGWVAGRRSRPAG